MKKLLMMISILVFISISGCGIVDNDTNDIEDTPKEEEPEEPNDKDDKDQANNEDKEPVEKEPYLESTIRTDSDGKNIVTNPSDIIVLVNKNRNLPSDYEPEDLISPGTPFRQGQDSPVRFMREEAGLALREMFAAGEEAGFIYYGRSGYRSYQIQQILFNNYAEAHGEEAANKFSARPGQSEHQTGLVMDITSEVANFDLTEEFGETEDGKWLQENAHRFGFILRYPKGKEDITGYQYEPWHYRYVGKEMAKEVYELDVTLEEYFKDYYN
ncbi:M15 family metallopeptidase [Clostridium sp. D2Q-11]|uniref:M15 family metallopeptidase n=1 Tax=Anaeromonas frigoriresistens TaxID=2683708 RepID=A0A942UTN1_9FIRM|nr:M15 family metallopeptidase [Anaeromonas frigoriresistens]MBS4538363.1 M15 family metallopeptidase [Anaeromonas frigoriresistens]